MEILTGQRSQLGLCPCAQCVGWYVNLAIAGASLVGTARYELGIGGAEHDAVLGELVRALPRHCRGTGTCVEGKR